eukprot:Skav232565  [mRNA]  locus=scaffold3309:138281:138925:- [translate_table: standard]
MAVKIQYRGLSLSGLRAEHCQRGLRTSFIFCACLLVVQTANAFVSRMSWMTNSRHAKIRMKVADSRMTMPAGALLDVGSNTAEVPMFQVILVLLCAGIPVLYWWFVIVPFKRRELAASKARGPLKSYLQELAVTPEEERKQEKWFYDKYLRQGKFVGTRTSEGLTEVVQAVEDELQEALPGGGFWSFDNPIFVCLVMLAVFCAQQVLFHDVLHI